MILFPPHLLNPQGPSNSVNALPQYCTPVLECQKGRDAGVDCGTPMGIFEPGICQPGFYCPAGGKEMLTCPQGHYCLPGTMTPYSCHFGSHCPAGSIKEWNFLALAILVLIDAIVISLETVIWLKKRVSGRRTARGTRSSKKGSLVRAMTLTDLKERRAGYRSLSEANSTTPEPNAFNGYEEIEPVIRPFYRVPTGFQAAVDAEALASINEDRAVGTTIELRDFIDSCSRCNERTGFGLSFRFDNLRFHPKGVVGPVLQDVTGSIAPGALVGVMGM